MPVFKVTASAPCPYLSNRAECKIFTRLTPDNAAFAASHLSRAGFRRSHDICYLPACPDCDACRSLRVRANDFSFNKKWRKVMRLNDDLSVSFAPNVASSEQYDLFAAYLNARHSGGEMCAMDMDDYAAMIEQTCAPCRLMLAHDRQSGDLQGAMLVDILDDGLSAVYSFFNPERARSSTGSFLILNLIRETRRLGLPYVYLGFFIAGCHNMAYKRHFRPADVFVDGQWVDFNPALFAD